MDLKIAEWNSSYLNKDNFLFYPHEEVIRFSAKYVAKRVGLKEINYVASKESKILDLGCGIGRHMVFFEDLGIESFGIDLSEEAVKVAKERFLENGISTTNKFYIQSAETLPWENKYFNFVVSHGVLDSMPFGVAKKIVEELYRVLKDDGLFYCDLIGEESKYGYNFEDEITVETVHENNTIQSYFTLNKIQILFNPLFDILESKHIFNKDCSTGMFNSRYHLVLKKKS